MLDFKEVCIFIIIKNPPPPPPSHTLKTNRLEAFVYAFHYDVSFIIFK